MYHEKKNDVINTEHVYFNTLKFNVIKDMSIISDLKTY